MIHRNLYLIVLFCTVACFSQAQIQDPNQKNYFAQGSTWGEFTIDVMSKPYTYLSSNQYFLGNDTLINNVSYSKLFYRVDQIDSYVGALREEGGKVYAIWDRYYDTNEFLLYDFTLNEGDRFISTVKYAAISGPDGMLVTKIDTIQIYNGESRKRFYFNMTTEPWVEGIGSLGGLLCDASPHATNGIIDVLVCFKQNNIELYKNLAWCNSIYNCCDLAAGLSPNKSQSEILLTGNVVKDKLNIYVKEDALNLMLFISIVDMAGKTVETKQITGMKHFVVDFSGYKTGVYIVNAEVYGRQYSYKVIKT